MKRAKQAVGSGRDGCAGVVAVAMLALGGCGQRIGPVDPDAGDATLQDAADAMDATVTDALNYVNTATLSAGGDHVCAIRDGQGYCWGGNYVQQLGAGPSYEDVRQVPMAIPIALPADLIEIRSGWRFGCARRLDQTVWCWGNGSEGSTGQGLNATNPAPAPANPLGTCLNLATSYNSAFSLTTHLGRACCVREDHTIACVGPAFSAEFHYPDGGAPQVFSVVPGIDDAVQVGVGWNFVCALRTGGRVTCWNNGTQERFGELGDDSIRDGIYLGAGSFFACVLRSGGQVSCWGYGADGELGDGTMTNHREPSPVRLPWPAEEIAVGPGHTCARHGGEIYCWGANEAGQLGNGTTDASDVPVRVVGISNAVGISAGEATCAWLSDATISCWGDNRDGELGNSTPVQSTTPTIVQGF